MQQAGSGDEPFVSHLIRLYRGENLTLRQARSGLWVCPVCGSADHGGPPYHYGEYDPEGKPVLANPEGKWASATYNICVSCDTEFGLDDDVSVYPDLNQADVWSLLRTAWLDRNQWSPQALRQLEANLGIGEAQARQDASRVVNSHRGCPPSDG